MYDNDNVFVKMFVNGLRNGEFTNLSASYFKTLVMLGSFVGENGTCYPNQSLLAKMSGVEERTIRRHIKELLKFRTNNGQPVLTVQKKKSNNNDYYYNEYKFNEKVLFGYGSDTSDTINAKDGNENGQECPNDVSEVSYKENYIQENQFKENYNKDNNNETKINLTNFNSKTVIYVFRQDFEKKYGYEYKMTGKQWGQFGNLLNKKVVEIYKSPELIVDAIKYLFQVYDRDFKKEGFERPSLWTLTNWIFEKCIVAVQEQRSKLSKDKERFDREQKKANEFFDDIETKEDIQDLLNKMNNRNNRNF